MIQKLKTLLAKPFIKGFIAVAGGSAFAQLINVVLSPIITRIYLPNAFGALGVFNSIIALLTPITSFGFSLAIAMPSEKKDAEVLAFISLSLSAFLSVISLPIIFIFNNALSGFLGIENNFYILFFLSPMIFFVGCEQVFIQWFIREKKFKSLSIIQVLTILIISGIKIITGFISATTISLILSLVIGKLFSFIMYFLCVRKEMDSISILYFSKNKEYIKEIVNRYKDFPLLRTPQNILNSFSGNIPTIMFTKYFGLTVTGYYSLSQRMLQLPITLISQSIGKVLLPQYSQYISEGKDLYKLVLKMTSYLIIIGLFVFGIIFIFGPSLFSLIFGNSWYNAGVYARWLSIWLFMGFINVPVVYSLPFSRSQGFLLLWEIFTTITKVGIIIVGVTISKNLINTLILYSITGAIAYGVLIFEGLRRLRNKERLRV